LPVVLTLLTIKDVVSYEVKELEPLELKLVGLPSGSKCGAVYVDIAFKAWLRHLIGNHNYSKLDPNGELGKVNSHKLEGEAMRRLMINFDVRKKAFTKDSRDIRIDLPEPLANLDMPGRVNEGQVTIPK
jgi:hypothetical protein